MQPNLSILEAMIHCPYKAWQISKEPYPPEEMSPEFTVNSATKTKIALAAWYLSRPQIPVPGGDKKIVSKYEQKAMALLKATESVIQSLEPLPFYKIAHCSECQFKSSCDKKLKEKDCISLLAGMRPKVVERYHKKGIMTIRQLSHLFRPRRSHRSTKTFGNYLYELKALAIREQKTFVLNPPDLSDNPVSIYIDFEGLPEERFHYLLGGLVVSEGRIIESCALWANSKEQEQDNFSELFKLLLRYPEAPIYHYGGYESKALKGAVKQWPSGSFKKTWPVIEKRMINLLGFLRTHIYPPTYGNGLKEIARFLGFQWTEPDAEGLKTIAWRKQWEETGEPAWKEKLVQYNKDDCLALQRVHEWLLQLAKGNIQDNIEQVSQMKRHSPYKLNANPEFGEDYQFISKAAYFNYQRDKIYWRNNRKKETPAASPLSRKPKVRRKGLMIWQPKKVNEIIIAPPVKKCPQCGSTKFYRFSTGNVSTKQTDLKFTSSGFRRHVIQYQSGISDCVKCRRRVVNRSIRIMHYGDNLFAFAINCYVNYHLSNYMISKLMQEYFGIWISGMYLVMNKYVWWKKNWSEESEYVRKIVLNSPVIHIDETTVKLSKNSGYVWVFATSHSVFYHYTPTRKSDFLEEMLRDYKGIIISDFFPGYETLHVKSQKCLIHLIRDLNDDLFKNPFDEEYKSLVSAFSTLLRSIIETIDRCGLQKKYLQKHVKEIDHFYRAFVEPDHKSELSVQYAKRFKKHWESLWTFLYYDEVPWNNNNAEAAVKAFAQHRRGVKGVMHERGLNEYLQMLSVAQTCRYRNISFLGFLRGKRGLWEHLPPSALPGYLPFKQARLYIHSLGFERKAEWLAWEKGGNRPSFIPHTPNSYYKRTGWISWHDWIGFSFLPFEKARTFMRRLKLQKRKDYWAWLKSGKRPKNIPRSPEKVYKHTGWIDLSDWLGTTKIQKKNMKRLPFHEAKEYVQRLGIRTQKEFFVWRKSGNRPDLIPADPERVYPEFTGWGDFLGTGRVANQKKVFWDYKLSKAFLQILGVNSLIQFRELYERGEIPAEIPKKPREYYKKRGSWISYPDFLAKE